MAKYQFSVHQKWAVFKVHGERCYLCRAPIDLRTMEIDHVIPESLLDGPEQLAEAIRSLGLPHDFDLNSFENWLPSCRNCNNQKRAKVFAAAPIMLDQFAIARDGAPRCREIEAETVKDRDLATSLAHLERAMSRDELDLERLTPLIAAYARSNPDALEELLRGSRDGAKVYLGFQIERKPIEFQIAPDVLVRFSDGQAVAVMKSVAGGYASDAVAR